MLDSELVVGNTVILMMLLKDHGHVSEQEYWPHRKLCPKHYVFFYNWF
jgi:hypothetical protein